MADEFAIIRDHFARAAAAHASVAVGIGDDAAVLSPPAGKQLVMTTDTLVAGRHFPEDTPAHAIGWKSLAVNLSDLAAMGAEPLWFTLSLTLPEANDNWLGGFASGLFALAEKSSVALVGGDTCRGPLSVTITAVGAVENAGALLRSGARPGDGIFVTGTLGGPALGLQQWQSDSKGEIERLLADPDSAVFSLAYPEPQIAVGRLLRQQASACIDVSDGVLADLGHLIGASRTRSGLPLAACIHLEQLPLHAALQTEALSAEQQWALALSGGDEYQLCFTLPEENRACLQQARVPITRIGEVVEGLPAGEPVILRDADGQPVSIPQQGYNHFA